MSQVVDPSVSLAKFNREVRKLKAPSGTLARGWLLLRAEFPIIEIGFAAVKLQPPIIALAARFDFTDYDVRPLSVRFIDPFKGEVLAKEQLVSKMLRLDPAIPPEMAAHMRAGSIPWPPDSAEIIQGYPGDLAFLCLPGVREYHDNSAHSGDPWELHRATGEGSVLQIAEKIWQYGADPIAVMAFEMKATFRQAYIPS